MSLLFIPTGDQYGPQVFCAAAVDNTNVQSDPWCITFLVGFTSPNLQTPLLVQGSASPVGTVFANQTHFTIQSNLWAREQSATVVFPLGKNGINVNRPGHNGTYVSFHDANLNGSVVLAYDCGYSTNVNYVGDTIVVNAPFAWVPGHQYYVTFDQGLNLSWKKYFLHLSGVFISRRLERKRFLPWVQWFLPFYSKRSDPSHSEQMLSLMLLLIQVSGDSTSGTQLFPAQPRRQPRHRRPTQSRLE